MTSTKIFVTGGTGYVGGSVVSRLLQHPDVKSFEITALVRAAEKAEKLNSLGVKTVLGSYADMEVLTKAAAEADIVFAMADSDNYNAAKAILDGLKQRFEKTGKPPILIHTTGTAFFMDDARGLHGDYTVYSDLQSDVIEALPEAAVHRLIDIPLVKADQEGYVKVYLVTPGTVYGAPSGPLFDLGIQNTHSMQLPHLFKASIDRKRAGFIGAGKNEWPAVSVRDAAELFITLFNAARTKPETTGHGRDGFYVVENTKYSAYEVMKAVGDALLELGIAMDAEPTAFTEEELAKYFGNFWPLLATNCGAKGDRSRAIGWKPVDGKEALLNSIKPEIVDLVKAAAKK